MISVNGVELEVFEEGQWNSGKPIILCRNWHLLADANPIIQQPTLMIYGDRDIIPKFQGLSEFVHPA